MEIRFNELSCSVSSQIATLTKTANLTEAHPSHIDLAGGGIVVNLVANIAEMFKAGEKYTVIIRRET